MDGRRPAFKSGCEAAIADILIIVVIIRIKTVLIGRTVPAVIIIRIIIIF
jgi:hypothetical protein